MAVLASAAIRLHPVVGLAGLRLAGAARHALVLSDALASGRSNGIARARARDPPSRGARVRRRSAALLNTLSVWRGQIENQRERSHAGRTDR